MRTLLIFCTYWLWRPLLVRWLTQCRDENVISTTTCEVMKRSLDWEHIWDRT